MIKKYTHASVPKRREIAYMCEIGRLMFAITAHKHETQVGGER